MYEKYVSQLKGGKYLTKKYLNLFAIYYLLTSFHIQRHLDITWHVRENEQR